MTTSLTSGDGTQPITPRYDRMLPPRVDAVLCDADGTLFPSTDPAHEASAAVINRLLAQQGVGRPYAPTDLQRLANGRNFRSTVRLLTHLHDRRLDRDELEEWVAVEKDVVTAHLCQVLTPDPDVTGPVAQIARQLPLSVVTSSDARRVRACLEVTGLASLFPPERLFSAETSLPAPASKPDPAVYVFACDRLRVDPGAAVAVEDSVNGVRSAVAAGCWTVGIVQFVPVEERRARAAALRAAGAVAVIEDWSQVARLLSPRVPRDHQQARRPLSELS